MPSEKLLFRYLKNAPIKLESISQNNVYVDEFFLYFRIRGQTLGVPYMKKSTQSQKTLDFEIIVKFKTTMQRTRRNCAASVSTVFFKIFLKIQRLI